VRSSEADNGHGTGSSRALSALQFPLSRLACSCFESTLVSHVLHWSSAVLRPQEWRPAWGGLASAMRATAGCYFFASTSSQLFPVTALTGRSALSISASSHLGTLEVTSSHLRPNQPTRSHNYAVETKTRGKLMKVFTFSRPRTNLDSTDKTPTARHAVQGTTVSLEKKNAHIQPPKKTHAVPWPARPGVSTRGAVNLHGAPFSG